MNPRSMLLGSALLAGLVLPVTAAEPIPLEQFEAIQKMVKPRPGEYKWADAPWLLSVREGQKQAAAQGKPLAIVTAAVGCFAGCL